jgi:hypothetical protein
VLADAPRSGTPPTFTAEQIVQIVNLACTAPRAGVPWTLGRRANSRMKPNAKAL